MSLKRGKNGTVSINEELAKLATSASMTAALALKANTADLGTAAAEDVGYFATAAQGALADTAVQKTETPTALTIAATTGTLPTADGSITVSDAATPTVAELLEAIVELNAKVEDLRTALR